MQERAALAGIELDVGEFPERETLADDDDPERLEKLTAHAVARIADRFPLTRKFSRHMEGRERRAGILSDVFAALVTLYKRNPDALETLAGKFYDEVREQRAQRAAAKPNPDANGRAPNSSAPSPTTEGVSNARP